MEAFAHQAGFDAWMTGAVFASLLSIYAHIEGAEQSSPLAAVAPHVGHINVSRSDFPYIALLGEDAEPDRGHVLVLTQLSPGLRVGAVQGALGRAALGMAVGMAVCTVVSTIFMLMCACGDTNQRCVCEPQYSQHSHMSTDVLFSTKAPTQKARVSSYSMASGTATSSCLWIHRQTRSRRARPSRQPPRGCLRCRPTPPGRARGPGRMTTRL